MARNAEAQESSREKSVFSPLHRLQADLSRDQEFPFSRPQSDPNQKQAEREPLARRGSDGDDNESLYSFESVSTNGRLLDRLDLDSDDYTEYEGSLRKRESTVSIQSVGRSWDLPSDESTPGSYADLRQIPIRANSSVGLERMRSLNKKTPKRSISQSNRMPIQNGPGMLAQSKKNNSFDSLHADFASRQNSSTSLASYSDSTSSLPHNTLLKQTNSRSTQKLSTYSPILESTSEFSSPSHNAPSSFTSMSPPRSAGSETSVPLSAKRSVSSSSADSISSVEGAPIILNPASKFDPAIDASTRKALAVRAQGNHREASYQLQILANAPYNYPKAMYLYAKALRVGQGVKLNESHSIKWLCRCILTSYIAENSSPSSPTFTSYVAKLANLSPETLLEMVKINLVGEKHDPSDLLEEFQSLGQAAINKIHQLNTSDKNFVGGAYFYLGDALLKGAGVSKDETTGRMLLAKAASLAYADGMAKLGELWCGKSKHFKKDYHVASAWLRLGEFFGKQDIGNSWIYKSKYLEQKKK